MRPLFNHVRVALAHTAPRGRSPLHRLVFLILALLLATQIVASAGRSLASAAARRAPAQAAGAGPSAGRSFASAAFHNASAPVRPASVSGGTPDVVNMDYTGTGGGVAMSVAIRDSIAYLVESNKLFVLDIHNPAAPQWLGEYRFEKVGEGGSIKIDLVGSYAYIADSFIGLLIIDISNPQQPSRCGLYSGMSFVSDIDVVGSIAYVAGEHFQILDVQNPCAPRLLGSSPHWYGNVVVSGGIAYLGTSWDGLTIMDVSKPAAPRIVGAYVTVQPTVGNAMLYDIAVIGSRVYLADGEAGLLIVDASKPTSPKLLGRSQALRSVISVSIVGSLAYVGGAGISSVDGLPVGMLGIINIGNPAAPSLVGSYAPLFEADDVQVSGSFAYVAVSWDDLRVIDISNPAAPTLYGSYTTLKRASKIQIDGSLAYIGSSRFDIVDLSQPNNPKVLSTYQPVGGADSDLELVGSLAYLAGTNLEIIDVHDPAHPVVVGRYDLPSDSALGTAQFISHVQVVGTRAYIGVGSRNNDSVLPSGSFGLLVLDVSNPASPQLIGQYDTIAPVNDLQVIDSQLYLAVGGHSEPTPGGLMILDIADPMHLALIGSFHVPSYVNALQIVGDTAYLAESYHGVDIIDISDRTNPHMISQYGRSIGDFPILALHINGALAYVMADDIELLNLTDLSNPRLYATYPTPGYVQDMQAVGDRIYVADGSGLTILNVERDQASAEIAPSGGSLTNKMQTAAIALPPNAVDSTAVVSYTGFVAPTQPLPDDRRVVRDFEIDAQRQSGAPLGDFAQPYTLELRYNQRQLGAALAQESTLGMVARDGDTWVQLPSNSYTVDTANHRVLLTGTQAREYALVGRSAHNYLPLMSR